MKKLLITLLCAMLTLVTFAQTEETSNEQQPIAEEDIDIKHLTFKGIPIDGTPTEFARELSSNGFTYSYEHDGILWYKGFFAGYNGCEIAIKSSNNLVYEIVVIFPKDYSWGHLYSTYSSLKDMLTMKYGEPTSVTEEFVNTPIYMDMSDDNDRFSEVKDNHCRYYASFTSTKDGIGSIHLEIKSSGCVGLHYTDLINSVSKEFSAIGDL